LYSAPVSGVYYIYGQVGVAAGTTGANQYATGVSVAGTTYWGNVITSNSSSITSAIRTTYTGRSHLHRSQTWLRQ
jgi:hypothetical protein